MDYIVAVDIGTTGTRSIAFNREGVIISKKVIEYPIYNPRPTWSEQDPEEIFKAVLESIKDVVAENDYSGNKLAGISFSSAMHSLLAVDHRGNPLTRCIIWADTRSESYARLIKESGAGHSIYMRTGTPVHPMSPLCKLLWMKDNDREVFDKAYKFISIKEYVFYKLFSKYIVDYSIASATGLFDIYKLKWDDEALNLIGISPDKLSVPVLPTYIVKGLKDEYARYLNIDKGVPFIVGASDGCLSNLGTNAVKPGVAAVTIGTSGAIRVVSPKPASDPEERIFSYILTENHYVLGGPVNNGGIALKWFKDNFYPLEAKSAEKENVNFYDVLTQKAGGISPGAGGLVFLPYLLGERAPHWNANVRGVFFGVNITHTREHFLRALMEGVVYGIYSVGKALEQVTGSVEKIYATGGFVRSPLWVKILSDVFNKEVLIAESYESSCLGAAVLAMKSLGLINAIEDVEKMVPVSQTIYPDKAIHDIYFKLFEIYERLYDHLKDEFVNIINLQ
ncbi:gluconokinase [Caldanaerobius polysaccharolyticus]|uniref:gluconokinase n=1 Tax=Caldanaerobius polysaccharolyticus TaxID=44256 RepID=UPI0004794035|nr:gluconokinase [Caldanaerobius polysaccharolyticus]